MKYKFLKHTADIKFRAFGKTLNEAFENSAIAMFQVMYSGKIKSKIKKKLEIKGKDLESLLYNFLEELLVYLDSEDFFLSKVKVKMNKPIASQDSLKLEAEISGDKTKNYEIGLSIKAVTYHSMIIKKSNGQWFTQVVLDV